MLVDFNTWLEMYMGPRGKVYDTPPEAQNLKRKGYAGSPIRGSWFLDNVPDSSGDPAEMDWDSEEEVPLKKTRPDTNYYGRIMPWDSDADTDKGYYQDLQHWDNLVNAGDDEYYQSFGREMSDLDKRNSDQISADNTLDQQYDTQDKNLPADAVKKEKDRMEKENKVRMRPLRTWKQYRKGQNKTVLDAMRRI